MRTHCLTLLTLMVSLWIEPRPLCAAVPPPEKLLPASTLLVVTVPSFQELRNASAYDPTWLFLQDEAMKPIVDKLVTKWKSDVVARIEKQFSIKLGDYADLAQGQLTLAFLSPSESAMAAKLQPFIIILDAGDKSDTLKKTLEDIRKRWSDSGKNLKTEKIRGVDFTSLSFTSGEMDKALESVFPNRKNKDDEDDKDQDKDKDSDKDKEKDKDKEDGNKKSGALNWWIGQSDSLLVVGNSSSDIEQVLALQATGSGSSLSESPNFNGPKQGLFRDAKMYAWANLQEVLALVKKNLPAEGARRRGGDSTPSPIQVIDGFGLSNLKSIAYSAHSSKDGASHDVQVAIPDSDRSGLVKMFSFDEKPSGPPPFIPEDVLSLSRTRIDWAKSFETLEATVTKVFPASSSLIKMFMDTTGKDKDPDFDLRKNLFGNLGDDYISYSKAPREKTLEALGQPPSLHLLGARDADKLLAALKTLSAFLPPNAGKKDREFLGHSIFSISMPGAKESLSFTSSGGYVAFSSNDALLEEYLRSADQKQKPLSELPSLTEDTQKVRGLSTGMFGYMNTLETARLEFEALKSEGGAVANALAGSPLAGKLGLDEDSKVLKSWLDFSLLPPFEKVSRYFHRTVYTGAWTPTGFELKIFAPMPPQLKH